MGRSVGSLKIPLRHLRCRLPSTFIREPGNRSALPLVTAQGRGCCRSTPAALRPPPCLCSPPSRGSRSPSHPDLAVTRPPLPSSS
ncbi:hypothetical protein GDO78_022291 [Eleutherodactylus coqui]|uniref:Uncharacterized protein n=1 Tax=Eleutherodactylus coqui TaxID=57060 RepID=A0A8J6BMQ4_ELECQ|nr:hypothetical protein GDO78_022291 [Eleutherodactylus coqui]